MKAIVIAIGSEITSGQITNSNASWISKKLQDLGVQTPWHLTVPDDFNLIMEALLFAEKSADLLFVTGGLGPTSDDFTRDVVAQWAQQEMVYDPKSWDMLSERLLSRGYSVKEIQRQQCYFPKNARVLKNFEGTANGFHFKNKNLEVFVLPGPPREVHSIWHHGITDFLKTFCAHLDKKITSAWDTLGVGESDVALMVQEALSNFKALQEKVEVGYRVHLPYVEVKVSYNQSEAEALAPLLSSLDNKLNNITITRNGQEIIDSFIQKLKSYPQVQITDLATGSFLSNKLFSRIRKIQQHSKINFHNYAVNTLDLNQQQLELTVLSLGKNEVEIRLAKNNQSRKIRLQSPHNSPLMEERRQQYFAEMALITWNMWL
ncbi:MAG: competence/damage-inducible protein A [Bdellovibrionia bacterium]